MIELDYEMTYAETIEGPLGPTTGSPLAERLCWQVTTATLSGPRHQRHTGDARNRLDPARWVTRSAARISAQLVTDDGELILLRS